jgi:hypothetical protein
LPALPAFAQWIPKDSASASASWSEVSTDNVAVQDMLVQLVRVENGSSAVAIGYTGCTQRAGHWECGVNVGGLTVGQAPIHGTYSHKSLLIPTTPDKYFSERVGIFCYFHEKQISP